MDKIFEHFTVTILKLNKLIQKIKLFEMQDYGLKAIHVMCVYYLNEHEDGLTASELVKFTLEDKAAISRALKTLQEKELIIYDEKKYNSFIRLTEKGKSFAKHILSRSEEAVRNGSATLTDEERDLFYHSLKSIATNLEKYYGTLISDK